MALLFAAVVFGISPFTKWYVEKNCKELTGRLIRIGDIDIDILSGQITTADLVMYEPDDTTNFVAIGRFDMSIALGELMNDHILVEHARLVRPDIRLAQEGARFNFDDLVTFIVEQYLTGERDEESEPWRITLQDLAVENGRVTYYDREIDQQWQLSQICLSTPSVVLGDTATWVDASMTVNDHAPVEGRLSYNYLSGDYTFEGTVDGFDLADTYKYLTPYVNTRRVGGTVAAKIAAEGNIYDPLASTLRGRAYISDMVLDDPYGSELFACGSIGADIAELNLAAERYIFESVKAQDYSVRYTIDAEGKTNVDPLFYHDPQVSLTTTERAVGADGDMYHVTESVSVVSQRSAEPIFGDMVLRIGTLDLRGGMDMSVDFRTQGQPFMSADYATGMYREKTVRQYEYSMDFLLKYNKLFLDERLGLTAAVGANRLSNKYASTTIDAPELGINGPGMYTMANSAVALEVSPYRSRKEIQSVYGFVNLSWDDTYFLDVTARNDWSSTLHPTKWSYFYPSVSASILLDNLFKIRSNDINMIKLRGSWANVGNDTGVYSLYPDYSGTSFPGSVSLPSTLPNAYIEPENCESWEIGLDTKFFGNRLGVDIALYQNTTTNQIISAAQSAEIGNTSMKINAGKIRNRGIEVTVNATPVKTRNWTWNINANWAYNQNMLLALTDEWDPATPLQASTSTTIGGRTYIYSYVGQEMYQLYGKDYNRAPEGSYYIDDNGNKVDCSGAILINPSTGYPSLTSKPDQHIARVTPRWKAGLNTSITWKDLTLSAQFTAQMGGNAFSVTNFALSYQGKLKNSLEGRTDGMVLDGVVATADVDAEGNTVYTKNTTITENAQVYYNTIKWVRDNTRENTFSTDFFKLRELRLDYRFPAKLLAKTKVIQGLSVGVFATNVFCITDWPQYDPEAAGLVNGTSIYPGVETGTFPMTRTYGFNVKIQF